MASSDRVSSTENSLTVKNLSFLNGVLFFSILSMLLPLLYSTIIAFFIMTYPFLWIRMLLRKKKNEVLKALPNVLDNITLLVEAGKDFFHYYEKSRPGVGMIFF